MALVSFFCSFASWLIYIYWAHGMFRSRNDGKSQALFVPLRSLVSGGRGSVKQVTSRVTRTEFRPSLECNKFRICLWVRTGFFGQVSMEARPEGDLLGLLSRVETHLGWFRPQGGIDGCSYWQSVQGGAGSGMAGSRASNYTLESWICVSSASFCVGFVLRQIHATSTANQEEEESPEAPRTAPLALCHFLTE